eukprot:6484867-Pyramimonas_sp.AAC.1
MVQIQVKFEDEPLGQHIQMIARDFAPELRASAEKWMVDLGAKVVQNIASFDKKKCTKLRGEWL